jgi:Ser/Thr protein kinase RdoA (MazF antagonist)
MRQMTQQQEQHTPAPTAVAETITRSYGLEPAEVTRIHAGTTTLNYRITSRDGAQQWFAKVYRDGTDLAREQASVELAEFARTGPTPLPVPAVLRTRVGGLINSDGQLPMSLWQYIPYQHTAEGRLHGARWPALGTAVGRLHRRLAEHPTAAPRKQPGPDVCDVPGNRRRFENLIATYDRAGSLTPFQSWARDAAAERLTVLDRVADLLDSLPDLTVQILHGDLASPNVLLKGDAVAAIVDFQPPRPRYLTWELARIALDPKTVLAQDPATHLAGLLTFCRAYREANPAVPLADLDSLLRVGCAAILSSTYPLPAPIEHPDTVTPALESYGRARHATGLALLARLEEAEQAFHAGLR